MADNGIGYTFQPGSQQIPVGGNQNNSGGPQSAIQVKSFTLPNRFVPGQIAPQALLQSPGGGGGPEVDIFRRLMSLFAPQGQQQGVPTLQAPPIYPSPFSMVGAKPGLNQTLPVPMEPQPQAPPFRTQPVPNPTPNQDVPQTPSMPAPPRIIPGDSDQRPGDRPPAAPEYPGIAGFDLSTPSGGYQNPLGRNKYEGFDF